MALYESCGHIEGLCPCLTCVDRYFDRCAGCFDHYKAPAVDTDMLCVVAKQYCESGRDDDD